MNSNTDLPLQKDPRTSFAFSYNPAIAKRLGKRTGAVIVDSQFPHNIARFSDVPTYGSMAVDNNSDPSLGQSNDLHMTDLQRLVENTSASHHSQSEPQEKNDLPDFGLISSIKKTDLQRLVTPLRKSQQYFRPSDKLDKLASQQQSKINVLSQGELQDDKYSAQALTKFYEKFVNTKPVNKKNESKINQPKNQINNVNKANQIAEANIQQQIQQKMIQEKDMKRKSAMIEKQKYHKQQVYPRELPAKKRVSFAQRSLRRTMVLDQAQYNPLNYHQKEHTRKTDQQQNKPNLENQKYKIVQVPTQLKQIQNSSQKDTKPRRKRKMYQKKAKKTQEIQELPTQKDQHDEQHERYPKRQRRGRMPFWRCKVQRELGVTVGIILKKEEKDKWKTQLFQNKPLIEIQNNAKTQDKVNIKNQQKNKKQKKHKITSQQKVQNIYEQLGISNQYKLNYEKLNQNKEYTQYSLKIDINSKINCNRGKYLQCEIIKQKGEYLQIIITDEVILANQKKPCKIPFMSNFVLANRSRRKKGSFIVRVFHK